MRKFIAFLTVIFILTGCLTNKKEEVEIASFNDIVIKGIWFSYVDYRDNMQGLNEEAFINKVKDIVNNCSELGINTIYVHAVSFTDAFYNSSIYPKTAILPGIEYDPLKIFIEEAHKKQIRVEAWINPMRSVSVEEVNSLDDGFVIKQWINEGKPYIRLVENRYYLNPAYEEANDLVVSVVKEIIDNYEVDGIHMDDYFYPEKATEDFDSEMLCSGCDLAEFRKNNVNNLVSLINKEVKKNNLIFGISPAGNMDYSINTIYGDFNMWIDTGIVDYLIPQIYWGYGHPTKPFLKTLEEWMATVEGSDVKMIIGLAGYKIGVEDQYAKEASNEWVENSDMLARQYMDAINLGSKGVSVFSYQSLFYPSEELSEHVKKEVENLKNAFK